MPWKEATAMSLRTEFVHLAEVEKANLSQVCIRFGISRKTGYKQVGWVEGVALNPTILLELTKSEKLSAGIFLEVGFHM